MTDNEITQNEKMPCFRIQFDQTAEFREALRAALAQLSYSPDSALLLHLPADPDLAGEIVVDETELSREVQSKDWTIPCRGDNALEVLCQEVEKLT